MEIKLHEYFEAGVRLVWYVEPDPIAVTVYTSPDHSIRIEVDGVLDGSDVLPGFVLPLREWAARANRR
jgi:Uma2 family endonuclease